MHKVSDAIGLPPMLCVLALLGLLVGALGVVRLVVAEYGIRTGNGPTTELK